MYQTHFEQTKGRQTRGFKHLAESPGYGTNEINAGNQSRRLCSFDDRIRIICEPNHDLDGIVKHINHIVNGNLQGCKVHGYEKVWHRVSSRQWKDFILKV